MTIELEELNRKLALQYGFKWAETQRWVEDHYEPEDAVWEYPDGTFHKKLPRLTSSLNACFKWIVPELFSKTNYYHIGFAEIRGTGKWNCYLNRSAPPPDYREEGRGKELTLMACGNSPVLAFCLAFEKLIDAEKK